MGEKKPRQSDFSEVLEKQINVTVNTRTFETMQEIRKENKLTTPELTRGLLERACEFFERRGWFGFPAMVIPVPPAFRTPPVGVSFGEPDHSTLKNIPVPHPDLTKFSYEDLVHELWRRERSRYPEATNLRAELNEPTDPDLAASAEQKKRKR